MGKKFTPEMHLEGEFLKFFRKLRRDLKTNTGASDFFDEIEGDIGEMLYTAQKDGKTVKDVIGDSEEEYLEELIKTFYETHTKKSIMAIKIGTGLFIVGAFVFWGFFISRNIMLGTIISIIGLVIYGILINKINISSYKEVIKYNKIKRYIMNVVLVPLLVVGTYCALTGGTEVTLVSIFYIFSIPISMIGLILVKVGNLNNEIQ